MENEEKLILDIIAGSERSFDKLYGFYFPKLYNFVYHYVKSEASTDDIVQETFSRIWTNKQNLNPNRSFKSYLFTISYHLLLKELRHQINQPLMEDYVKFNNELFAMGNEAESAIDYDNLKKHLTEAKQKLSPRQREIFELRIEKDYSIAEIAQMLSISDQVVRNQLSAALKQIRMTLMRFFFLLYMSNLF